MDWRERWCVLECVLQIFMTLRKSWIKTVMETGQYEHSSSPKCFNQENMHTVCQNYSQPMGQYRQIEHTLTDFPCRSIKSAIISIQTSSKTSLTLCFLERHRLRGNPIEVFKWYRGYNKGNISKIIRISYNITRNNGFKLDKIMFKKDRKELVLKQW